MPLIDVEHLLKQAIGFESVGVGSTTVERAVRLRMACIGVARAEDYWETLRGSTGELQELIETVIVPETWFFRDQNAFAAMVQLVIEEWRPIHPAAVLRALSIPCSTGEEPYSILMALVDGGFTLGQVHVDAVDISARALAVATPGVYGTNSFRGRDLAFRDRHFRPTAGRYALSDSLRGSVHFRQGNLLAADFHRGEPPYDVVFCRNLLIYFDRATQALAMNRLGSLLAPGGFLFVGPAEAFVASCNGFSSVDRAMSFAFRKTPTRRATPADLRLHDSVTAVRPRPRSQSQRHVTPKLSLAAAPAALAVMPADLGNARRLADAGRLREAAESCEDHVRQGAPSAEAYHLLGVIRDAMGAPHAAAECYRKAVYLEPEHVEALIHLALLTERQGDIAAGRRLRERARRAGQAREGRTP
jgi:chemotaxis protein methyltransferase WspC